MKFAKQIFLLPGKALAWWGYMFPAKGDVWASRRRVDSTGIHILYSFVIWALLAGIVAYSLFSNHQAEKQNRQGVVDINPNVVTTQDPPYKSYYGDNRSLLFSPISSINCSDERINTIDLLICSSPQLLESEARLNSVYQQIISSTAGSMRQLIQDNQEAWFNSRGENCGLSPDDVSEAESTRLIDCLQDIYDHRLTKLQNELKKPH